MTLDVYCRLWQLLLPALVAVLTGCITRTSDKGC